MESSSPPNINFIEVEEINDDIGGGGRQMMEKEHMFDKVVTPSDVGKLNRLVIPKQHAEKYFPFDSSANEKGLLLNFEDRNGKPWRFRYSYWNSSQSYVMTKGWSRFVKEKKLDAGDIVSFLRGVGEVGKDVLFIDWRRRPDALQSSMIPPSSMIRGHQYLSFPHPLNHPYYLRCRDHPTIPHHHHHHQLHLTTSSSSYGMVLNENPFQSPQQLVRTGVGIGMMMQMQRGGCGGGGCGDEIDEDEPLVFESVPVVQGKKAVGKRLRLFGVNMECPISESSEIILPSTAVTANYPMAGSVSSSSSSTRPYPSSYINAAAAPLSSNKILNKGKGSLSLDFDV